MAAKIYTFVLVFIYALLGCTPLVAESRQYSRIIFGTEISPRNSSIVQVRESLGDDTSLCTGTVISPTMVLTAWHCVTETANAMSVIVSGKKIKVKKVYIHPNVWMDETTGLVVNDVAILKLSKSVSVAPVPILISQKVKVAETLHITGYGVTEFGYSGALNRGKTIVESVSDAFIESVFGPDESNTCSGDSGGPALQTVRRVDGKLVTGIVGVTSTGTRESCLYGDRTNYINLQSPEVNSFIFRVAARARRM